MNPLTPAERRDLRAKAHHLEPVVMIGQHGLTPQVLHEIDLALLAHELIKVKVLGDDREVRNAILDQAVAALDCAPVQHVGKIFVLWRSNPEIAKAAKAKAARVRAIDAAAQLKKAPKKKTGPRAPVDNVRARRRAATPEWGSGGAGATGKGRRGAARHGTAAEAAPAAEETSGTTRRRTARRPREG